MTARSPKALPTFDQRLGKRNLAGARLGYVLAAILIPACVGLDFVMYPQHWRRFLAARIVASLVLLILLGVSHLRGASRRPVLLGAGPPLVAALTIEYMILEVGPVESPYYAGLNLCILAVGVLYTWKWQHAMAVSGLIVACWLVPALAELQDVGSMYRPFVNNLYFLVLTAVISVASTVIRYGAAQREHAARSDQIETSRQLKSALDDLQKIDRMKSEFFANISHELRTPLTLILAPLDELMSRVSARDAQALKVVRRNGVRLLRLIEDLLDLARADMRGLRLQIRPLNLAELAKRVIEAARPAARSRGVQLDHVGTAPSEDAYGDAHRLETVITNLVANALKFSPAATRVEVRTEETPQRFCVTVSDKGPGIPLDEQERIFERFYQVEGSRRRQHGGAGIGLELARQLARLHGGDLQVRSVVGEGSAFTLWIPKGKSHFSEDVIERRRRRASDHPNRRAEDRSPRGLDLLVDTGGFASLDQSDPNQSSDIRFERGRKARVLIAEDEQDLRSILAEVFRAEFHVIEARDGVEAWQKVREERPDLIVTDVMMPRMTGMELCQALREDPMLRATPLIMLTALSGSDAALEAYASGANDFVTKPFHARILMARARAHLRIRALSLQLADQARLASAGTLAAGMAHEVRNPLNAVINASKVVHQRASDAETAELTQLIVEGSERILSIVAALEAHVRPGEERGAGAHDVREGLEATVRLLKQRLGETKLHWNVASTKPVLASARALNQVFLNLIDNAIRANPGNIWVEVMDKGAQVGIRIADDGVGISGEVLEHVFDPFFTTRPPGEGTGLGLYLCRKIVHDCGGCLEAGHRAGGGTEFVIRIPATEAAA